MTMQAIELRKTHQFVGDFDYLDTWIGIGKAEIYMQEAKHADRDEDDFTEPMVQRGLVHMIEVEEGVTQDQIRQAIRDTFTKNDCHHEHDCCGCRSFRARAKHVSGPIYKLTITSSRNF